jgi:hypothetical protein
VPDLVTQLITPFEVRLYSAEYEEFCTLNSSMPSTLTPFMAGSLRRSLFDSDPSSCSLCPSSSPPPMRGLLLAPITPGVRTTNARFARRPPLMNRGRSLITFLGSTLPRFVPCMSSRGVVALIPQHGRCLSLLRLPGC